MAMCSFYIMMSSVATTAKEAKNFQHPTKIREDDPSKLRRLRASRETKIESPPNSSSSNGGGIHIQELTDKTKHLTNNGLWEYLDCEKLFRKDRPVHSQETWIAARQLYREIVGVEQSSIGTNQQDVMEPDGFSVKTKAMQAPPKGRGIFAAQDIPAGALIWSTKKTARYSDGDSYRKFNLSVERGFACDVLQWTYIQRMENGELRISTDLDNGSFCNGGGSHHANMGCDKEVAKGYGGGCTDNYFALRDIKAGEELLCAYGSFAVSGGWKEFSL